MFFAGIGGIGIPTQDEWDRLYGGNNGVTVGPAAPGPRTAADLKALIQTNGGAYYVWTTNVNTSAELQIAKANPITFAVAPVANDPGSYKLTLRPSLLVADPGSTPNTLKAPVPFSAGASALSSYAPYIVLGVGAIVLLSVLRK